MARAVLVLSPPEDGSAGLVVEALAKRESVHVVWFDVADFPLRVAFDVTGPPWRGTLRTPDGVVDVNDVCGVLYRRPTQFRFPAAMSDTNRRFAVGEARVGFGGILSGLACRWVNHPARVADAELKPVQLQVAEQHGLATPRTLITNVSAAARAFCASVDAAVVYKTLTGASLESEGRSLVVYTSVVDPADLDDESIGLTAHMFQELVPKAYDARVTVVGDRCFAVAVDAGSATARLDFRADYASVTYRPIELPPAVRQRLRRYLDHFGLAFGAFDLVVTPEGRTVFLECNPNGEWSWIQDETGLPIAEAMADYLVGERDG